MQERRRTDRCRAFQAGTVAHRERRATVDCVVRNLSDDGALLLLDQPMQAPCEMDLTLDAGGATRRASVVWRDAGAVGVVFSPVPAPMPPARGAVILSLAEARRASSRFGDDQRLAERVARISAPTARPRPDWAWPRLSR